MVQDLQVCSNCGAVFDLERRQNKDCPLCHSGKHMRIQQQIE
jgi:Zn finger protein HypA/HybF involved in hydrogenase expression